MAMQYRKIGVVDAAEREPSMVLRISGQVEYQQCSLLRVKVVLAVASLSGARRSKS